MNKRMAPEMGAIFVALKRVRIFISWRQQNFILFKVYFPHRLYTIYNKLGIVVETLSQIGENFEPICPYINVLFPPSIIHSHSWVCLLLSIQ